MISAVNITFLKPLPFCRGVHSLEISLRCTRSDLNLRETLLWQPSFGLLYHVGSTYYDLKQKTDFLLHRNTEGGKWTCWAIGNLLLSYSSSWWHPIVSPCFDESNVTDSDLFKLKTDMKEIDEEQPVCVCKSWRELRNREQHNISGADSQLGLSS